MSNEKGVTKIGSKLIVSIYLDSIIGRRFEMLRCIYCGHPILETVNKVKHIVDNPGENDNLDVGLIIQCKRCKQRYRVVLHRRYYEI